jgi:acyl-CoA thioesterase
MEYNLRQIREKFAGDLFAARAGIEILSVSEETVECRMKLEDFHRNAAGGIQGGAIFTLGDLTFAVHSNLGLFAEDASGATVGQSCSISYLRAPKGSVLFSRSRRLSKGRSVSVFIIEIYDDAGTSVAEMLCNGFTKNPGGARPG